MFYIYSKCKIHSKFVKKTITKEMVDNFFPTYFNIQGHALNEHLLRVFLFITRTGGFPTRDSTKGQW